MTVPLLVTDLSPEQRLALSYAPSASQVMLAGVFALDRLLGQAVARGREPLAAQLRLAWWRESLTANSPPFSDWRIDTLRRAWRDDPSPMLAMVDGWEELTAAVPDWLACVRSRAAPLEIWARDMGCDPQAIAAVRCATELWLLLDLADHLADEAEKESVRDLARAIGRAPIPLPRAMRPLAVLGGLAWRALARGGPLLGDRWSPLAAMRLGIFGR